MKIWDEEGGVFNQAALEVERNLIMKLTIADFNRTLSKENFIAQKC